MRGKRGDIRRRIRAGAKQSPHELASCYGKIRHSTYEAAVKNNAQKIGLVKAYKCKHCPYYHVGRKP
jgi:hypothetical protein